MKKSIPAIKQITMQVTRGESVPHHQQTIKKKMKPKENTTGLKLT